MGNKIERPAGSAPAPYPATFSREQLLAQLGALVLEIQSEALKMLQMGTHRSGIDHWTARELFHAIRSLGLLGEEKSP